VTNVAKTPDRLDEIVRLSRGKPEDRVKAARLIVEQSSPASALSIAKELAEPTQPEEVRLELVEVLDNDHITFGASQELTDIFERDPSEVVREKSRIIQEIRDLRHARDRAVRPRRLSTNQIKSDIDQLKLQIVTLLFVLSGLFTIWLARDVVLQQSTIDTLIQTNATVLALAFTIPLAAAQFSRYEIGPESFFNSENLAFFLVYGATIFLPLLLYDRSFSPLFIGLSVMCFSLVFPFLFRVTRLLAPSSIVDLTKAKIEKRLSRNEPEPGLALEYLAYQALEYRDYGTFAKVILSLSELYPVWLESRSGWSYDPLQLNTSNVNLVMGRVGEASLVSRHSLMVYCHSVLQICTERNLNVDEEKMVAKRIEFNLLNSLADRATASEENLQIILAHLVRWCVENFYSIRQLEQKVIDDCTRRLSRHESVTGSVLDRIRERIGFSPWSFVETMEYEIRWSFLDPVKYNALRLMSKLELAIARVAVSRRMRGYDRTSGINFLEAIVTNAKEILDLQKIVYGEEAKTYDDHLILPLTETLRQIEEQFGQKKFFKAIGDGRIVGSIRGYMCGATCWISRLAVHPIMLGVGIEENLVRKIESFFQNAKRFEAVVYHKSQDILVYQRLGYQISKEVRLSQNITMLYLEKSV